MNIDEILNKPAEEAKAPEPLPAGAYSGVLTSHRFDKSSKKQTPFVAFKLRLNGYDEDEISEEDLPDNWMSKELEIEFYLSESAQFILVETAEALGIDKSGKNLKALIEEMDGKEVTAMIIQESYETQDGKQRVRNRVNRLVAAAE
jgi:hypothetical protein